MRQMNLRSALMETVQQEMRKNDKIYLIGEDVTSGSISWGFDAEFGKKRIIDTPISEKAILGAAIGGATVGLLPVAEIMFVDFAGVCFDEILNQMSKSSYMFGGQCNLPITVRLPTGAAFSAAAHHSQSLEAFFTHIPGIKVVYSGTLTDIPGLFISSIYDPDPVMFIEHRMLYAEEAQYEDGEIKAIPLGKASVVRDGKDITVVATGNYVRICLEVANEMQNSGIDLEVIDPRTLFPLDTGTIFKSVEKTGKLLVVTEEVLRGAWSGELVSTVAQKRFDALKKAPIRIGALDIPIPFSPVLEKAALPQVADIIQAVTALK